MENKHAMILSSTVSSKMLDFSFWVNGVDILLPISPTKYNIKAWTQYTHVCMHACIHEDSERLRDESKLFRKLKAQETPNILSYTHS